MLSTGAETVYDAARWGTAQRGVGHGQTSMRRTGSLQIMMTRHEDTRCHRNVCMAINPPDVRNDRRVANAVILLGS